MAYSINKPTRMILAKALHSFLVPEASALLRIALESCCGFALSRLSAPRTTAKDLSTTVPRCVSELWNLADALQAEALSAPTGCRHDWRDYEVRWQGRSADYRICNGCLLCVPVALFDENRGTEQCTD